MAVDRWSEAVGRNRRKFAKMKIFLPLVVWIVLLFRTTSAQYSASRKNVGIFGLKHEVFFLNLEDGYFGCQVNESTDYLQLYELSKLCDGTSDCYMGSDELRNKLKCTNDCDKEGTACSNGVCLEGLCHCNDGFGGCNCQVPDENECKYRPCDVFAHCTNTLGSFTCTCFPGYRGDGFHCEDIDECQDPAIAARCVENAECCNLPAHFVCKCKPGFEGDGEERCTDINECVDPQACGVNAECVNYPGNYTCLCKDGFYGDPYNGCADIDECAQPGVCGPGAICTNYEGGYRCDCPSGFDGDARSAQGCADFDECTRSPCGRNALCRNDVGSFRCQCPDGFQGDPMTDCQAACTATEECNQDEVCSTGQCINPCHEPNACGMNAECLMGGHFKQCSCPAGFTGDAALECVRIPVLCTSNADCIEGTACHESMCLPRCRVDQECALNEKCIGNKCMLTCRLDNDCFLGHICLNGRCSYGCHSDDDCSASETCRANKCTDPCQENPCGPNAACTVVNHRASCSCINGMVPSPTAKVGCVRAPALQCTENRDCAQGTSCIENLCRPVCANDQGCLNNERCDRGTCKPICRRDDDCRNGEVCQGQTCMVGCRSDAGCPGQLACVNQQCVDPCQEPTACGTNALCSVVNHRKQCSCPPPLLGDPLTGCRAEQRSCQTRSDCPKGQACYGNSCMPTCRNDQNCLADERCIRGTCRTVCNSDASCTNGLICENRICQTGCRTDNNCPNNQACINKQCTDPCTVLGQCGTCSECSVVNHGVQCSCPNGYLGNPLVSCAPPAQKCNSYCYCDEEGIFCADKCRQAKDCACGQTCSRGRCRTKCNPGSCPAGQLCQNGACMAGCQRNTDCPGDRSCVNRKCVDPCAGGKACGKNAICQVADHQALCLCPDGFQGDPRDGCVQYECQTNEDCELDKKCVVGKCTNPCLEDGACGVNAQCRVVNRQAQCSCTPGFFGNARQECQPLQKESCSQNPCGENTICREDSNGYECTCQPGCMGNPKQGCLCEAKQTNKCHNFRCGTNAICRVTQYDEPECYCPPLYPGGDPYKECTNERTVTDCRTTGCAEGECVRDGTQFICRNEIGCRHSDECPAERSCINGACINPCQAGNPCEAGQECEVQNHEAVCIKLCQCQRTSDCGSGLVCDGCNCISKDPNVISGCEHCPPGVRCNPLTGACVKVQCTSNDECPLMEACVGNVCRRPCDVKNPCAPNAVCINRNHGSECSCIEGYHGNGFVSCQPVTTPGSVCQYNEDCPPEKLCDRLNRVCINPCQEDSCGDNADCFPRNHGVECRCRNGFSGNAYIECVQLHGCRSDSECGSNEACINGQCLSPCQCGPNALCDVRNHKPQCKCPPGYSGDGRLGCSPPSNPCDPNPCGLNAMCEIDAGSPVCFCPKGLTGNPFKNCIPEGDKCTPNPCGPNTGCRKINGQAACFCLPEYEGNPPEVPCKLPHNPCEPSPCGPNTQCTILNNGFAKCTCLSGYIESPNTIRGCIEPRNPCEPNPCGFGAVCDSSRNPVCYCPEGSIGNPFRDCREPVVTPELCKPGPCGTNSDCYIAEGREQCYCRSGYIGDPYAGCVEQPRSVCEPNPCGPGAECLILTDGAPACRCPPGLSGDPTSAEGCHGYECRVDNDCAVDKACIGFQCVDPCPGSCGTGAHCKVEKHHPVCFCNAGLTGNPAYRCYALDTPVPDNQCKPGVCGINTQCTMRNRRPVCKCLPNYKGDPKRGCKPECELNSDCPTDKACYNRRCVPPCNGAVCGVNAECQVEYHTPMCKCPNGYTGDAFVQCVLIPEDRNMTRQPCQSSPCGPQGVCSVYGNDVALCDPCSAPDAIHNPRCRPQCVLNTDCPFNLACLQGKCQDPCPGSCGYNAICTVEQHRPVCSCPPGLYGNPYERCIAQDTPLETCDTIRCGANTDCKRMGGVLACVCKKNYFGDPLVGCRPECVINTDCPNNKACVNNKCQDPCVGVCGVSALCKVVNHIPVCYCPPTHTGDALVACTERGYLPPDTTPCDPNPCGPNSKCLSTPDNYAVCSCLPGFRGVPPACQAECMINAECPQNKACINLKCVDPCPGTCGVGARCEVLNHNPICSCGPNQEGDPFVICEGRQKPTPTETPGNPCDPSPCGLNSICQVKRNRPVCSCQPNFIGSPPHCRPECVLSTECPQDKACINEKCQNPCANACGANAECHVVAHSAFCNCKQGFEGDAFVGCSEVQRSPPESRDPCYPSPCAENALCSAVNGAAKCTCIAPYLGDPYNTGCRPECVLNSDCASPLACINQHCRDPCPGVCGSNAECIVANHIPVCECSRGFIGDPFRGCRREVPQQMPPSDPCAQCPSNSVCRIVQGRPTCSCPEGYRGAPPACRPECSSNEECPHDQSCINLKCKDPCPGLCGVNAQCQVINHKPFCSCLRDYYGNPFEQCMPKPAEPVHPCQPSPCGPYSECREVNDRAVCSCVAGMLGAPPNCRPECETHQDCPSNRACFAQKCKDPCVGSCGFNAQCVSRDHRPECYCMEGFEGDPYTGCSPKERAPEPVNPCNPSPCGANAECKERNGAGSCSCLPDYFGDPYTGCRPECVQNSDCDKFRACVNNKCKDPCPGVCGLNAECRVQNHSPLCYCLEGYTGDPNAGCSYKEVVTEAPRQPGCSPSPCGPNSNCREVNGHPVCSCQQGYIGTPPSCRPECAVSSECSQDRACVNQKCVDPCPGTCGTNARCQVVNHNPICSCSPGFTGDPFIRCEKKEEVRDPVVPVEPCLPSPCGPNSQCRVVGTQAACTCQPNYIGRPPNCRPECTIDAECASNLACQNERCVDPCPGACGSNAICQVVNHRAVCSCSDGYEGDPFRQCDRSVPPTTERLTPCTPSPCGPNAECRERNNAGACYCLPNYEGNPYDVFTGCRRECDVNSDCAEKLACVNYKCVDPCPGVCGTQALCEIVNHVPTCVCPEGMIGDPFTRCVLRQEDPITRAPPVCDQSTCGPNSICRIQNGVAICKCQPEMTGSPPNCRPECQLSTECDSQRACVNYKCIDPCPGSCGQNAKCQVINHNPICSCSPDYTGDPFSRCYKEVRTTTPLPPTPCVPSPCGPNAECKVVGSKEACSCLPDYTGSPPNCRPECVLSSECAQNQACIRQKCTDPCPGSCGLNARCTVINHTPSCSCEEGYTGDPFTGCQFIQVATPPPARTPEDPCDPSPCGTNARCRPVAGSAVCECIENYFGNAYTACRPECVSNSECSRDTACIQNRCKDPCPGVCGYNAECSVINHTPTCTCPEGMIGNAFEQCSRKPTPPVRDDPCYPSPCGLNTVCRSANGNAVCECLPDFKGTPFGRGCYPECTINSDCPRDRTCVNKKCVDPCPGVCGYRAVCNAINNSPVCSCPSNMIGDPFVECKEAPPKDPCNPSPCRTNGVCRVVGGRAECQYPECVINSDCSSNRACFNQKCRDPCAGACGVNAICNVVNHSPICSCPERHVGSPFVQCNRQMDPIPQPECTADDHCTNDKACINQQCVNPCTTNNGLCNLNAECRVQFHRAICTCREGYTGNAQVACYEIGCRADSDCPATEACVNRNCVDPCKYTQCGRNAVCRTDYNHNARCHCLDGYRGNPLTGCSRPECTRDDECPYHLSCQNEQCRDPCNCAPGAQCRVDNHRASCRCPPGYTGDASFACEKVPVRDPDQCKMDADCSSKLACFSGVCKNPCHEAKPCAEHAICTVQDTLPLRTMYCVCEEGYAGDAEKQCVPESSVVPGCSSDVECAATETCRNRVCVNPCTEFNPCARSAECLAQSHKAICSCPIGMVGDPFQNCYREPVVTVECTVDTECASDRACINQRCQDPCAEGNPCGGNAECRTLYHRPLCMCPRGWGGDPKVQCYKPECLSDNDCPYDKACYNEKCLNPCTYGATQCGRGAECLPQGHRANCMCPAGTQGNPLISCVTGLCQYNEDCADHEACDRLNRVCRPVCDDESCTAKATCIGRNHQATCECAPGTRGNPYVECVRDEPEPECRSDSDCPSQQACLNNRCDNPCARINPCSQQQTCSVVDTLPLRTMICACPTDMLVDDNGQCKPIVVEGCRTDSDCPDTDRCIRGQCTLACRAEPCGINSLCESRGHQARCACPPEYIGNPHIECTPEGRVPSYKECAVDSDCPLDRSCINEYCVNPCTRDVCGRGAICHVQNHNAVCNCPTGYTKDRNDNCIPPSADLPKCQSNSDCTSSETCVNEICANPCNCGQNADCYVKDHYPVCSCKPGYSGNAQFGCFKLGCSADSECANDKQCFNGECLNPCALENPCALNAECYGDKHRAVCRCLPGLEGNPFVQCRRVECHFDGECPDNRACVQEQCVDPCSAMAPCAQNAICFTRGHAPHCKCPDHLPDGNPFSYCERRIVQHKPECSLDVDCPSRLACINNKCVDPCRELLPCATTAKCTVLDSVPVRTMVCECPELHVPDVNGECKRIVLQTPPECTSDSECSDSEACINRQCRNPCNCGENAMCTVRSHRGVCSCENGFEGNPNIACRTIGCRVDSECESSKACINGNCVNPCLDNDPCGVNAECYAVSNRAECRCLSGYRGNPLVQCTVVECRSNNDCPNDKQCRNTQCVDPCIYDSSCSPRAECKAQNHLAVCRCPSGLVGNPYVDCRPEIVPECVYDTECPSHLACIENKCVEPCGVLQPCNLPARCEAIPSSPVRTMICVCPDGYVSSGSGTCKPVVKSGCISDSDCSSDTACINSICRDPCNCGPNAECRIKDHKPVCSCKQGFDGNPEIACEKIECRVDDDCSGQHSCINRQCVPVCSIDSCGKHAECYAQNHRAICECLPGYEGDSRVACKILGCRADSDCPLDKACINAKCENPCESQAICAQNELCQVYQHRPECACPPPFESDPIRGCVQQDDRCRTDGECPSQTACIQGECVNPCNVTEPCGVNSMCKVLDTLPVRTMICECLPGYQGNAAIQCDKMALCPTDRGFIRNANGECACPPGYGLSIYEDCQICREEDGLKVDQAGRCVCALERGMIIDERGRCICPVDHGYRLTERGECVRTAVPECTRDSDCPVYRYCNEQTRTCEDPCTTKHCGTNALCNATNHQAVCQCIAGYTGNPELHCNQTTNFRTDFPQPDMQVTCQADGVQVVIDLMESNFNGVLYVKGHSKDEECRRVVNLGGDSSQRTQIFKVHFGSCGLIHVNGVASFILVIQKHPKLVTYKAQAYHIKCVYQTGEKNVTLGFNVQMLTTAGTIANTGPPPTCAMRIVAYNGEEINSAEIGDNLRLQVEVQPATIYGGFARSCVAKTMEDSVENEYIVTDENGCATEPSIFGDWEYQAETNSLLASFNAFKFPSSDNIRFQCNIRVCFGRCQPVNCHGANAYGKRRRRAITDMNEIEMMLNRTRRATSSNTALASDDTLGIEGTLREEITIQSNAILTLERREERSYDSDNITPAAQRVEDICVSMIGLIIALVITALLALVAVAVAVSCWLMAYRRRPTVTGPLPHPPEFPNPLFAHHEPSEPSHDYMT